MRLHRVVALAAVCLAFLVVSGAQAQNAIAPAAGIEEGSWEDYLSQTFKVLVTEGLGMIPEVGGILKGIVGFIWPKATRNIWTEIKDRVEKLVDTKILAYEINERSSDLDGIKGNIESYMSSPADLERGERLTHVIGDCISLFAKLSNSINVNHTFIMAVDLAFLHVSALRERVLFGERYYLKDMSASEKEKAKSKFVADIEDAVTTYHWFVWQHFKNWRDWRWKKIVPWGYTAMDGWITRKSCNEIRDELIGEVFAKMCASGYNNEHYYDKEAGIIKSAYYYRLEFKIYSIISRIFQLHKFIKDYEKSLAYWPQMYPSLTMGSIQPITYHFPPTSLETKCTPSMGNNALANITEVWVRSEDWIDALAVEYEGKWDSTAGNANGGTAHSMKFEPHTDKCLAGIKWKMSKAHNNIISMQLIAHDNTTSPEWGNTQHMGDINLEVKAPAFFCINKIASCSYRDPYSISAMQPYFSMPNYTSTPPECVANGLKRLGMKSLDDTPKAYYTLSSSAPTNEFGVFKSYFESAEVQNSSIYQNLLTSQNNLTEDTRPKIFVPEAYLVDNPSNPKAAAIGTPLNNADIPAEFADKRVDFIPSKESATAQ